MPEGRFIDLEGQLTHAVHHGGDGRVVLLVHGLGGSHANWITVAPKLARLGSVVSVDLPGFGLSPPAHPTTVEAHAHVVAALLERLDQGPATLIGNSMGGLVCEMVAARRPELVGDLVLVAPATPFPPGALPRDRLTGLRLGIQSVPGLGALVTAWFRWSPTPERQVLDTMRLITYDPATIPPDAIHAQIEVARLRRDMPWAVDAFVRSARSIRRTLFPRRKFVELVSRVRAPTLVVSGDSDRVVDPAAIDWLLTLRPEWRHERLPRVGHVPMLEAPARFLEVVEARTLPAEPGRGVPSEP